MECVHLEENAMVKAANVHLEAASRRCSGWLPKKHIFEFNSDYCQCIFDVNLCVGKTLSKYFPFIFCRLYCI